MTRKSKYRDISEIIERHLEPRLKSECRKLGIPESFVAGIYGVYAEPFGHSSQCEPVIQEGQTVAVRIRIDSEIRAPSRAVMHFWHELRHAKDCYEKRPSSEWKAHLYVLKRCLSEAFARVIRQP